MTFRNARLMPLWIADEEGYFKKQGLDVKQVNISGGTQGAQMMVSGGVDVSYDDPITCIVSTAGGVPVNVIVGGHAFAGLSDCRRSRDQDHRRCEGQTSGLVWIEACPLRAWRCWSGCAVSASMPIRGKPLLSLPVRSRNGSPG